jgi:secreted trypsin-like serine protease
VPFIVALHDIDYPQRPFCAASLINNQWIVTAAHCIELESGTLKDPKSIIVHRLAQNGKPEGTLAKVSRIFRHPDFVSAEQRNDIALLKLEKSYDMETSKMALLASLSTEAIWGFAGSCAAVAGWGVTLSKIPYLMQLQATNGPVISASECRDVYSGRYDIQSGPHLCAGYVRSGIKDACFGDSGGPLIIPSGANRFLLIGIVSFGDFCAQPKSPGVYARVSTYRDWIFETVDRN